MQQEVSRRPKCLYIMPDFSGGGPERISAELFRHLPGLGIDLDLLLFRDIREYEGQSLPGVGIISVLGPEEKISRHMPRFFFRFLKIARKYDILIGIDEADPWPIHLTTLAGIVLRKKVVWAVHTCLSHHCRLKRTSSHQIRLTRLLSRFAARIIAVSHGVKDDLVEGFGISDRKVEVLYNPNNIAGIQKLSEGEIPPEDRYLFDKPVILSVGHITKLKGQDLLIAAAAKLQERGIDCNIVLLGSGEDKGSFKRLASELGVCARVFMPGYRADPFKYMAQAEVFVLSSRLEGLSSVIIESMACGCPVVATDCPSGPSEILDGGKYGILVAEEDADGIAAAIEVLLSDREKRDRFVRLGLERAWDFDGLKAAEGYAEVIRSL